MATAFLAGVLARDLRTVRREVEAYVDDATLWQVPTGITNSAGTLALHLAGNIQHFVGAVLGGTGYVRDRDAEFSRRDVPRGEILAELDRAIATVEAVLPNLAPEVVTGRFPQPLGRTQVDALDFLIHLAAHLAYHLGQIDYHRRLVTGDAATVAAQAIPELRSATPLA